jgi:ribosomal protein S18 acetylase RimI-like enzyme
MERVPCLELEIIDIRRFELDAFLPLLEAESHAWHDHLRWDFAASARLISTYLRGKRLAGYGLVLDGRIGGYCFFFYDGEKGLIGDLFVEPSFAGMDQVLRLLEHVLETLLATPGLHRVEAQLAHFSFEDLEGCFRAHGFQGYRRRFMVACLEMRPRAPATLAANRSPRAEENAIRPDDFFLIPWDHQRDRDAAELLHNTYRQHVDAAINDQYNSQAGAARLIENIVHQQSCGEFSPGLSRLAIHRRSQSLAGILTVTTVRPHTAHIPQVAVARTFQGRGLGTLLIESLLEELTPQGYQELTLTVTDTNEGAVRLYERLGFVTFKGFGAFVFNRGR